MLQTAVVAVRDRARLQEIVGVLLRFGLADLVDTLGLARFAPRGSHGSRSDPEHPLDASVNPLENYKRQRRAFRSSRLRLGHCTNLSLG
jgi:hypothetical protein